MKILFSGMVAGDPFQGGASWAVLQYVLGFRALGHDVMLVEPVKPAQLKPAGAPLAESENAKYFRDLVTRYGLNGCAALVNIETRETVGAPYSRITSGARHCDVAFNVSGMLPIDEVADSVPVRVYLDLDPGFVQVWHAQGVDMRFGGHTHFVTVGQNIGRSECAVPTCGINWIPTLQPVVMSEWPVTDGVASDALTTVGNWRAYGSMQHEGVFYGQKAHSLRPLFPLAHLTAAPFVLAMSIHPDERADLDALSAHGWRLVDPKRVAGSPDAYRDFVGGSWAEFGVAKSGYVASRSGWFSDRSACYLASGRPVVAQDTGLAEHLPLGRGLLAFGTIDEAAASIESLRGDYATHARIAREIAETYFESGIVLSKLLESVGGAS